MRKETQQAPDRIDQEIRASDALERARLLPPGPERNEALKLAGLLALYGQLARARLCKAGPAAEVNRQRSARREQIPLEQTRV